MSIREFTNACRIGDVKKVHNMLESDEFDYDDEDIEYFLKKASKYNHFDIFNILINRFTISLPCLKYCFFNACRKDGQHQFFMLIYKYVKEDSEILYKGFRYACFSGQIEIIKEFYNFNLLNIDYDFAGFIDASNNGHLNIIQELYNWNQPIPLKYLLSALTKACINGKVNIVKQLIIWNPYIKLKKETFLSITNDTIKDLIKNNIQE